MQIELPNDMLQKAPSSGRLILASEAKVGQSLVYQGNYHNERIVERIVEVCATANSTRIKTDGGHSREAAFAFFKADKLITVLG